MPSAAEARSLFRAFLRVGNKFSNYNIREYVKRRAGERFREAAAVTDADALAQLWQRARAELEVAQRQAQVYALYARSQPSIMDLETRHRQH